MTGLPKASSFLPQGKFVHCLSWLIACTNFLHLARYDTTSFLLHLICYELAFNIEVQEELQNEIDSTLAELDGKPISYEALHKMKLLDMVVSEGLRIWPPAPQTDRSCQKDYNLKNNDGTTITIKKGEIVFFPIYSFHRDEAYWPNPNKFDPQRFSDENKASIVPGSYFPFGSGPRACIGEIRLEVRLNVLKWKFPSFCRQPVRSHGGETFAAQPFQQIFGNKVRQDGGRIALQSQCDLQNRRKSFSQLQIEAVNELTQPKATVGVAEFDIFLIFFIWFWRHHKYISYRTNWKLLLHQL